MSREPEEAADAVRKASDPDRLMPGEDPESNHPEDAEHWIEVYGELIAYKERLLAVTQTTLRELPDEPARREVAETDGALIIAERDRFAKRLLFWDRRLAELKQ